jgi:hypothetical protein
MARRYNVGITSVLRRCDRAVGLEGVKGFWVWGVPLTHCKQCVAGRRLQAIDVGILKRVKL